MVFFQLLAARVPRPGPDAVAGIFQASSSGGGVGGLGLGATTTATVLPLMFVVAWETLPEPG